MTTHATHAQRMRALPPAALELIGHALLGRPLDGDAPYGDLLAEGHLAVDALLVLARQPGDECRDACAVLLGHPLGRGPTSAMLGAPAPYPAAPQLERILRVGRNPRLPTTPGFQRYRQLRVGRTVVECLSRGVTRRDLREWVRDGHVGVGLWR